MTALQWILLCVLFTLYLLFGGSVFMYFESTREIEKKEEVAVLKNDIKEILFFLDRNFYHNDTNEEMIHALTLAKIGVIHRISSVCDVGDLLPEGEIEIEGSTTTPPSKQQEPIDDKLKWNFYNSVFFAFTVITTIGYGHLSPSTKWSKVFVMIYALIGIPINSILLSGLGDYFSSRLVKVHKKSKDQPEKKLTLVLEIIFYLVPGIIVFIIMPAGIFVVIESWSFLDSVYYAFVSLTTIGFGDYVAGMGNGHTVWMWIYKAFIIIWITFGLGYLIMILGFISKGMTHKRVRVVIEKRLNTIRFTKEKLSRDIDYMRRVVNELYLMKVKPVYDTDEEAENFKEKANRTQSQPCIKFERRCSSVPQLAPSGSESKETNSVYFTIGEPESIPKVTRRCSDSDLEHIDRDKTFESAIRQQVTVDELLVTVVKALSGNVMNEVMDAVEELNEYEYQVMNEGDNNYQEFPGVSNTLHNAHGSSHSIYDKNEELPPWDLGALSESDEEVLIGDEETDTLEQVIVHGEPPRPPTTIMRKVSDAIRKISSGSKTPSEGPSRKVSRNESSRRISRNESFERRQNVLYGYGSRPFINPQAYVNDRNTSQQRKISEESRISNCSTKSRLTDAIPNQNGGYGSNASSRKISPAHFDEDRRSKISLESTSLAEFLQALDNVHSKLNSKTSVASSMGDSCTEDPYFSKLPIVQRSARRRDSEAVGTGSISQARRRKHGIVHPDFSFVNNSFVYGEDEEQEQTFETFKNSPDPKNDTS